MLRKQSRWHRVTPCIGQLQSAAYIRDWGSFVYSTNTAQQRECSLWEAVVFTQYVISSTSVSKCRIEPNSCSKSKQYTIVVTTVHTTA
jgi:hypothetical protein